VKGFFLLSAMFSVSVIAAPIGACVPSILSNLINNPCALGGMIFDNFAYSGNVPASNVNVGFEMVGNEFHVMLTPATGSGFFTAFTLTNRASVMATSTQDVSATSYVIIGVKDQSNFSAMPGSSGLLTVSNAPGPNFNLTPGNETGSQFFSGTSSVTTAATLTGPGGTGSANPGLTSLELDYIQSSVAAVPEPATFGLIGIAFLGGLLLRKRRSLSS